MTVQRGPTRRTFLTSALAAPFALKFARSRLLAEHSPQAKPVQGRSASESSFSGESGQANIVIIISDDQGKLDLGCYGNRFCTTPNLDALAGESMRMTSAFTPTAICTPSRAALLTGLYPHRSGAYGFRSINPGIHTLPEWIARAGYRTGIIGKVHVSPLSQFPFDVMVGVQQLGFGRDVDKFAAEVQKFLSETRDQPFFLMVCYADPHRPFPTKGIKKGRDAEVPNPHDPEKVLIPPFLFDTPETRLEIARYYDAIRRMDRGVGLVLQALRETGKESNAIVFFTSDNGMPFPFAKTTLYDAGINMPFLVRWPGVVQPGFVSDAMISFVDIPPTCLDIAGAPIPSDIDGRSFLSVLRGAKKEFREVIFASHTDHAREPRVPSRAIRTHRYKYIYNFRPDLEFKNNAMNSPTWRSYLEKAGTDARVAARVHLLSFRPREELYDLKADPFELSNLASDPSHNSLLPNLRVRLREWMQQQRDPFLTDMKI
jgi:N-sulfoglucosamine sulfohydrolase